MDREKMVAEAGQHWELTHLKQELADACKEIVALRKALHPFARESIHWETYEDDEPVVESFPGYEGEITVGDLRRAYEMYYKKVGQGSWS